MKTPILTWIAAAFLFPLNAQVVESTVPFDEVFAKESSLDSKNSDYSVSVESYLKRMNQLKTNFNADFRSGPKRLDSILQNRYQLAQGVFVAERKSEFVYDATGLHVETQEFANTGGNTWVLDKRELWSQNSANEVQWSTLVLNGIHWDTTEKVLLRYDAAGNVTDYEEYSRVSNGANWSGIIKEQFSVDMNGDVTLHARYSWNATHQNWDGWYKFEFDFSAPGELHFNRNYSWNAGSWVFDSQIEYLYDSMGNIIFYEQFRIEVNTGQFIKMSKREYAYASNGNLIMMSITDGNQTTNQWEPRLKHSYFFNSLGNDSLTLTYDWTTTWVEDYKTEYDYNANNLHSKTTFYQWDQNAWKEVRTEEYSYDAQGREIEFVKKYRDANWNLINTDRETNSYTGSTQIEEIFTWRNNQWWPNKRNTYALNTQNQIIEKLVEHGNYSVAGQYTPKNKHFYSYDGVGNIIEEEIEAFYQGNWIEDSRLEKSFDLNNKQTSRFHVMDVGFWYIISQFEYHTDPNQPISGLTVPHWYSFEEMVTDTFSYELQPNTSNKQDDLHAVFYWSDVLNSADDVHQEELSVYPNPTTKFVTINNLQNSFAVMQLFDVRGKLIKEFQVRPKDKIDVSSLSSGVYLYCIQNGSTTNRGRIIKE